MNNYANDTIQCHWHEEDVKLSCLDIEKVWVSGFLAENGATGREQSAKALPQIRQRTHKQHRIQRGLQGKQHGPDVELQRANVIGRHPQHDCVECMDRSPADGHADGQHR